MIFNKYLGDNELSSNIDGMGIKKTFVDLFLFYVCMCYMKSTPVQTAQRSEGDVGSLELGYSWFLASLRMLGTEHKFL